MGVEFPSKYALLLLTKISILYSILHTQHTLRFAKIPTQKKVEYERCDSRSIFVLIPIHGEEISYKKIHLDGISKFYSNTY